MYDSAVMAAMDRRCCEYADVVIASAAELRDRCLRWNPNTHLVTHGVDYAHFASSFMSSITSEPSTLNHAPLTIPPEPSTLNHEPLTVNHEPFPLNPLPSRPPDLPAGPIIGFFGLLSEWVDQALLLRLARALPQAHVVLIGKADVDVAALKGVSNIHVLGPRLFTALPAYLAHFTVGIIPFVVNDLTRAVNPIKLREMLSGGCPVVSSALPEVAACVEQVQVGGAVVVAETAEAFEAGVRRFVEAPLDLAARRALSERMRGETWEAKVDEILKIVGPGPADGSADRSG
jgi:glycosyltransferase involved in cell wall biosynthesis